MLSKCYEGFLIFYLFTNKKLILTDLDAALQRESVKVIQSKPVTLHQIDASRL